MTVNNRVAGDAALIISRAGQTRIADHITNRIDVVDGGLIVFIHFELAATICFQANRLQVQCIGIAGTTVGKQNAVGFHFFAGLQMQNDAIIQAFNRLKFFAMANGHTGIPKVVTQGIRDLSVHKRQQSIAGIDQINPHA